MLQLIIDYVFFSLLNLDKSSKLIQTIHFFVYDTIKILLLLFVMISVLGFFRTYISRTKIKQWLKGKNKFIEHFMAAVFGAVTPFCSCSSIPIFISFISFGIPIGVTLTFLVTSPIINEYLVVLMLGFFGFKITFAYIISGIIVGVFAGMFLDKFFKLENYIEKDLHLINNLDKEPIYNSLNERILYGLSEAKDIIQKLWKWIFVAVGIGAVIHNYIPAEQIQGLMEKGGIFTVPIALIIGVPLYGSCAAIVPIAIELFNKGLSLGTTLTFMMAVSALSLPEAIILRRAMKLKLIGLFFLIVALAILFTGYLFNILEPLLS